MHKELVKERFDEIIVLSDEKNSDDLIYYFKRSDARERFDDFNNWAETFNKIKSGDIKIEKSKILQNMFKSNLKKNIKRKVENRRSKKCIKRY